MKIKNKRIINTDILEINPGFIENLNTREWNLNL